MEENTDMNIVHTIRFGEWLAENYEPCGINSWKKRFPKTTEETLERFFTKDVYKEFLKS
jgi:hypothetical protein